MNAGDVEYGGQELALFARAVNWKKYWSSIVAPWIRGNVLEVGAGIGANTPLLTGPEARTWTCVEPDPRLARQLQERLQTVRLADSCDVHVGTIQSLPSDRRFDAILYVDVLEHIADDRSEIVRAMSRLRCGGALIVLAPAHQWLFSPFDRAVGHHRRYTARALRALTPPQMRLALVRYLDSVGLLASATNAALLRQELPGLRQILFWDRLLVPCSRAIDPVLGYRIGKSVLSIWERSS